MGALKKPKELTYDELNALTLRLFRELEVAEEAMSDMYRHVQDGLREADETIKSERLDESLKKQAKERSYALRNLFNRYNNLPEKLYKMREVVGALKKDFRERAAEQWVRVEKFLTLTSADHIHRDVVTGEHISSAFQGWDNPDQQEETLFNEERLYEALGKDDARTILAMWRRFHELRTMRRRIDFEDDKNGPGIEPGEVMFLFRESELFRKMEHLLSFSKSLLPKLLVDEKKADKHTEPQYRNLQRQLGDLFERLGEEGGRKTKRRG